MQQKFKDIELIGHLNESGDIEISENGYYNPEQISWPGTMSKQRVGDLLPLEYKYDVSVLRKQH